MGNFLTQAGSDFWDILRKKLPESFGMEWGVPDSVKQTIMETGLTGAMAGPLVVAGRELARTAINAYTSLPTASNEDISKSIQGRVALSGIGGGTMAPSVINPGARAEAAPRAPVVNSSISPDIASPIIQKNSAREAINNLQVKESAPYPEGPITFTGHGTDMAGGGNVGAKSFPGYSPSEFTQQAISNLRAQEAKGTTWTGELTAARHLVNQAMSADVGMTAGQQNYDIAKMKAPGDIAKTAAETARLNLGQNLLFSGEEVGYWDPVTGARNVLTKGKSAYGDSESLKNRSVQQELAMKEIEEINKALMTNITLLPKEKEGLETRKRELTQGLVGSAAAKKQTTGQMSEKDFRDQLTAKGIPPIQHQQWIDQYRKAGRLF